MRGAIPMDYGTTKPRWFVRLVVRFVWGLKPDFFRLSHICIPNIMEYCTMFCFKFFDGAFLVLGFDFFSRFCNATECFTHTVIFNPGLKYVIWDLKHATREK